MDFRTEWSSWVLILLMIVITYFTMVGGDSVGISILYSVGIPLITIAIASIPVLIFVIL